MQARGLCDSRQPGGVTSTPGSHPHADCPELVTCRGCTAQREVHESPPGSRPGQAASLNPREPQCPSPESGGGGARVSTYPDTLTRHLFVLCACVCL